MDKIYVFNGQDITLLVCMQLRDVAECVAKRLDLPFDKAIYKVFASQTWEDVTHVENALWAESAEYIADRFFEEYERMQLSEQA